MTLRALLLSAVLLGGCFQTEAVLTVRPDGSATLVEVTRAEGYAGVMMLDRGVALPEDAAPYAAVQGAGIRLDSLSDAYTPGALTRTIIYEIDDVAALRYRFGRSEALFGLSGAALSAAFSPTGGAPRRPGPEAVAATTYRFERDGDALRVAVPERAVATSDVWSPDLEVHGPASAGTVTLRFTVRAQRSGAEAAVVDLDAEALFASLPPRPGAYPPEDPTQPEPLAHSLEAYERATVAYRQAVEALAADAADGADRPGLHIAPPGPLTLAL